MILLIVFPCVSRISLNEDPDLLIARVGLFLASKKMLPFLLFFESSPTKYTFKGDPAEK